MKFLELAGGNLNFRHWPVSANDVIAVQSLKPALFIPLWSGHSAGSFGAVLSAEWPGGCEAFLVLEDRTGQSNLRSRTHSPSPPFPHPQPNGKAKRNGNPFSLTLFPVPTDWQDNFPFGPFIFLPILYSLFIEYPLCARFGGIIQFWPRTCPWEAHFLFLSRGDYFFL